MRVLIVGLGSIAKKHIRVLQEIDPSVQIYAFRSSRNAEPYPGVTSLFTFEEAEQTGADFVVISNPTSEHAGTVRKMLKLGIPMFIEKPLFSSLGNETIIEDIRKQGLLTYIGCDMRFWDCVRFVKTYMENPAHMRVNEVNAYCGSFLPEWRPGTDFRKCYSSIPELGGGVHLDLIHEIDYLYWIFGKPQHSRGILRNVSSLGIPACDYANYCLEYDQFCASVVLNYFRRDAQRYMDIVFDSETWHVDMLSNRITSSSGEMVFQSGQTGMEAYYQQMKAFVQAVQAGAITSVNDIFEAYEVLKICLDSR